MLKHDVVCLEFDLRREYFLVSIDVVNLV